MDSDNGSDDNSEVVGSEGAFSIGAIMSGSASSSSSSSSSGSSFGEDFFQIDGNKLHRSNESISTSPMPTELASKEDGEASVFTRKSHPSLAGSELVPFEEAPPSSGESDGESLKSEHISNERKSNLGLLGFGSPVAEHISNGNKFNLGEHYLGSPEAEYIPNELSPESDRVPSEVSSESGESDPDSPGSTSTPLRVHSGLMQSPNVQVMKRPNNAYRIPSSVFARSTPTPGEWSVASNESLFSIHVGNNSFSRDHIILMGRSGELGKSGELSFQNIPEEYLLSNTPPPPIPVMDPENKKLVDNLGVEESAAEIMKEVLMEATEDRDKAKVQPVEETRNSSAHRSDESGASIQSFAFPILIGDTMKSASVNVVHEQQPPKHEVHSQRTRASGTAWVTRWWCWFPHCNICFSIPSCHSIPCFPCPAKKQT